jgi:hypothetical protein
MYLGAFGEHEAGRKAFVRTRQHIDGWTDVPKLSDSRVPAPAP